MHAVYRSGFQHDKNRIQVFMLLHAFGNHIYKGETILPLITDEDTLFRVTDAAIGFFEKNANPGERFRLLLQRVGEDEFRKEIQAAYKGQE